METTTYAAWALTTGGKIGVLNVTRELGREISRKFIGGVWAVTRDGGRQISQEWTGEEYPNTPKGIKDAVSLVAKRNGCKV